MALSRKFLSALGLEGDKVDEIILAHSETVDALKEERDKARKEADSFKEEAEKLRTDANKVSDLNKEIAELKKAVEDAESQNGENAWKVKYDAIVEERDQLKADYDKFKKETTEKETTAKKDKAYRTLLKESGVSEKRIDAVMKVTDLSKIELDEEGNAKEASELMKTIKEDWADFITTKSEKGADTATPPDTHTGSAKTKEEIMAIKDRGERQKAIAENAKLFGIE